MFFTQENVSELVLLSYKIIISDRTFPINKSYQEHIINFMIAASSFILLIIP